MTGLPFQIGVFLGAYLLFLVQPLIAKQILPWFGGAPAVWSTCLLFFQLGLVVGYAYAHISRRLGPATQINLHLLLLIAAAATLPISASAAWKPPDASAPVGRLLGLLTVSVGAPYVVLAATAPLLQDWFAKVIPDRTPYRLYVLSNAGSLAALLSYPALVEPWLSVRAQSAWWSIAFVGFVIACGWCAWNVRRSHTVAAQPSVDEAGASRERPPMLDRILWITLSACGSALLLATTNQLCQDVAVVPLLWIVPLAIYLVTFIVSFAGRYSRPVWGTVFFVGLAAAVYTLATPTSTPLVFQAGALLLLLAAGCMVCHGELVHLRPAASHLTAFYLALSVGGSLGGIFVALVAPMLFDSYAELPLLIVLVLALLIACLFRDVSRRQALKIPAALWAIPAVAFGIAIVIVVRATTQSTSKIAAGRNFYGVLRVADDGRLRGLYHGRVLHGAQFVHDQTRSQPTTYYAEGSGIDVAIRQHPRRINGQPLKIGAIGLGAGTIAFWGEAGDTMRFYELNPQVVDFAYRYFTFLTDSHAKVDVVKGDARLSLEREMDDPRNRQTYDVLVVDAFSGDSIPIHLLTRECFALYRQTLKPDGVLALHLSNQYLDLSPVVRGLAAEADLDVVQIINAGNPKTASRTSIWMLASANQDFVDNVRPIARAIPGGQPTLIWTDSFSSLISVLR